MAGAGDAVALSTSAAMADAGDDDGDNVVPPASWPSLPGDLLARILSRLTCTVHYLRTVLVCKRWAEGPLRFPHHLPVQPPVAFFSEFSITGPYYNPATGISRHFSAAQFDEFCFGTSHGWLLLLSRTAVYTVNPVTYQYVLFPPLFEAPANMLQLINTATYPNYRVFSDTPGDQETPHAGAVPVMVRRRDLIRISVLSSDPGEDLNFAVLIVLNHVANRYLYCWKGVDSAWATITLPVADFHCSDLAPTRNKKIYAIDRKKEALIAFDFSNPAGSIAVSSYTISGVPRPPSADATFLLESADGSLLLVNKIWEVRAAPYSADLVVFRLDLSAPPQARALPVADIGARNALFVCEGGSACVDVSAYPRAFRPNHVYFFRPFYGYNGGQAFEAETIGIFSMEKGELTADSQRLPRGWPCVILGKVRWLFFNLKSIP